MKKTIRVTITKEFEIDIKDQCIGEESIEEFETHLFTLDEYGCLLGHKQNELFCYVARMIFDGDMALVEGIGEAVPSLYCKVGERHDINFKCVDEDIQTEIIG